VIARLLISPLAERVIKIRSILVSHLASDSGHPDLLYIRSGEKLGIAESRKIKEHFSLKPYSAKGRVVVLEDASVMTDEAQNALLKTLEELPKEALLILGADTDANLLPTVLSRCQIIRSENLQPSPPNAEFDQDIEKLLSAGMEERFGAIEKLKNKEEFLAALVAYFHQDVSKNRDFLTKLLQAEEWAKQNVNIRAILEYLMLVMPHKI